MPKIDLDAFESGDILHAIDHLDRLRALLADSDFGEPSIRDDLITLHKLAMNAQSDDAPDLADHAFEVECLVDDLFDAIESIQTILTKITDAIYDDEED